MTEVGGWRLEVGIRVSQPPSSSLRPPLEDAKRRDVVLPIAAQVADVTADDFRAAAEVVVLEEHDLAVTEDADRRDAVIEPTGERRVGCPARHAERLAAEVRVLVETRP